MQEELRMSRNAPHAMHHPYAVFTDEGIRLGLIWEPHQVAKILAGDPLAGVLINRRGYVVLHDLDAWLCLERTFTLRDYLPESFIVRRRTAAGRIYFDLRTAGYRLLDTRAALRVLDSRRPGRGRAPQARKRR